MSKSVSLPYWELFLIYISFFGQKNYVFGFDCASVLVWFCNICAVVCVLVIVLINLCKSVFVCVSMMVC